jgi:hypothetical protein
MDTDKNIPLVVLKNSINRANRHTFAALDAKFFSHHDTASLSLPERTGRTDCSAGSRITGEAAHGHKACR